MPEMTFSGPWPAVLDEMLAWTGDTVVAEDVSRPKVVVVVDAKRVLEAKRSGSDVGKDFSLFRNALQGRYGNAVRFGWVKSADGHSVVVEDDQ